MYVSIRSGQRWSVRHAVDQYRLCPDSDGGPACGVPVPPVSAIPLLAFAVFLATGRSLRRPPRRLNPLRSLVRITTEVPADLEDRQVARLGVRALGL